VKSSNCGTVREHLSEYLDEALSGREMQRVAAHLAACEVCRREFDDLRVTKAVLQREAAPSPRPDFWAKVYADVGRQSASIPAPRVSVRAWLRQLLRTWTLPRSLAAGAAVAAVLLAAVFWRPLGPSASVDDVDDFIAQHAYHSAAHPLSDWSNLTFISSEMNAPKAMFVSDEVDAPSVED
jgi:anti-sigma factor RsiW